MDSKTDKILDRLEKELKSFIRKNPKSGHILYDSFVDHKDRYKKDLEMIHKYYKGGKVLDIGASPFHLMYSLKRLGIDVEGVDISPDQFKKFIDKYSLPVKKCNIETEKLPFENNFFDFIILTEVFEHLRINPIFALSEIHRVLRHGGTLFLTTPNLYAIHKIFMFNSGLSFNDAYDEFNKLLSFGYAGHIREYSTKEMKKFLEKTGFRIEKIMYQNYYSFFRYAGFENNIFLRLAGLAVDILMAINPCWRRHQVFLIKKI